jgi:hypothetical protein
MKFQIGDIVTDTRNPYPHQAPRIGTIVEIDPPAGQPQARYRVKWSDKRTWLKESSLKLADAVPLPQEAPGTCPICGKSFEACEHFASLDQD